MTGIKLTPLLLFVLLLVVLVISVVFGKMVNTEGSVEGYVAFMKDAQALEQVWIPQYSSEAVTVYKLNDNMFFDSRNGNLIELDAEEYSVDVGRLKIIMDRAHANLAKATTESEAAYTALQTATDGYKIIREASYEAAKTSVIQKQAIYDKALAEHTEAVLLAGGASEGAVPAAAVPAAAVPAAAVVDAEVVDAAIPAVPAGAAVVDTAVVDTAVVDTAVVDAAVVDASGGTGATQEGLTSRNDATGITITGLYITKRDGLKTSSYAATNLDNLITPESRFTGVTSSYATWSYPSQCKNTSRKDVIYMAWNQKTYIIIFDKDNTALSYTIAVFDSTTTPYIKEFRNIAYEIGESNFGAGANKIMKESGYKDELLYMLHHNIGYDIKRGNVYVNPGNGITPRVLDRTGELINLKTQSFLANDTLKPVTEFSPWSIIINNKIAGFVIPSGEETLICTFSAGSNGGIALQNVKRFGVNGVYIRGELIPNVVTPTVDEEDDGEKKEDESDDYILKTQIVPPVCPSCPACPDNVTCTNCGGQGGSGTLATDGRSIVDERHAGNHRGGIIREVVSDTSGLARDAVSGADELARDAVSGADELARDAVGGTVGLAKDAVGGTVGLAKEVVGGTVGLAKDTVSGAAGLLTGAASGVAGLFKTNPMQMQTNSINQGGIINPNMQANSGRRPRGSMTQSVDNTNYFGALPDKPSTNYMPVTADFSAFSR